MWAALSLALAGYLAARLLGPDKTVFLPGATTSGHHQIELACGVCHQDAFGGGPVLQDACINCHGAELAAADDSHPQAKFTDPRNADRLRDIDARQCIACHVEHRPDITGAMGVTLPVDFCISCHAGIGDERPTHAGLDHMTCQTAGCHHFGAIDIGRLSPAFPVTPPGVRVRTGRFGGLSYRLTVNLGIPSESK